MSSTLDKKRKEILMRAGYPERKWVTCGYDPEKGTLWCSRPATKGEWEQRWKNYVNMQHRLRVAQQKKANT